MKVKCEKCQDNGWVCEEHQDKPHEHKIWLGLKECGGAGMPCTCNKAKPPWRFHKP